MKMLKRGDRCPCCGEPIPPETSPCRLLVLSFFGEYHRLPTVQELLELAEEECGND